MDELKKLIISCTAGVVATLTKNYALIFVLVCFAIVFDCITGIVKCKATGRKLSSKKGTKGFWKKVGFISAFCFGIFLDFCVPVMLSVVSVKLPFNSPFGLIIGCYILLNESISICENLIATNPKSVPKFVLKFIETTKEKMEGDEE